MDRGGRTRLRTVSAWAQPGPIRRRPWPASRQRPARWGIRSSIVILGNVAERRTRSLLLGATEVLPPKPQAPRATALWANVSRCRWNCRGRGGERAPSAAGSRATGRRIPSHAVFRTHRTHRPCRHRAARLVRRLRPIQIGPRQSSPRPVPIQRSEGRGGGVAAGAGQGRRMPSSRGVRRSRAAARSAAGWLWRAPILSPDRSARGCQIALHRAIHVGTAPAASLAPSSWVVAAAATVASCHLLFD